MRDCPAPMACEMGECGHIDRCIPDPTRECRGWCPYCQRPVYSDQLYMSERRTNGVTTQLVPVHDDCNPIWADENTLPEDGFGRCANCGAADERRCPCTTGQSSIYFTRDML